MRTVQKIVALTAILISMIGWAGDSTPFLLDTIEPLVETGGEVSFSYNSSWIGGYPSAEVVISADGTEIKRTTGVGEFAWLPTASGKHTLTYTTFINGVAQDEVYEVTVYADWKYTIEDGKAMIVETTQKSGSVTIPSEIDGYSVVGFMDGLFDGCTDLTQVVIPGNLVAKMSDMFSGSYDKLTSITLIGDVTEIPQDAFAGCESLESFVIPDGTTTIGMNAFDGCSTLTDIVIPDSVYSIGLNAFANCTGLTSVTIPDSVYTIGTNAFANCTDLTKVSVSFPLKGQIEAGNIFLGCSENLEVVYREAEIKNIIAKQRFPWNGKVDIEFEIEGNPLAGLTPDSHLTLVVTAEDRKTGARYVASEAYLSGDMNVVSGVRKIVWDLASDGCKFKSGDIAISVACALSQAEVLYEGQNASIAVDTRSSLLLEKDDNISLIYNSSWVGGDSSAEVVISADGSEIKRTTGEGEFMWSPTTAGKHTLTYTTYINGVAQEEVYTATVYADWKYTVEDGKATIVETAQRSGSVTIPSKIDGFLVVGLGDGLFNGCEGLTSVTISDSVTSVGKSAFDGCTGIRSVSLSPTFKIRNFNSGLIQAKFNSSDDFTSSIIDSESKSLVSGVLMGDAYDTESVTRTYTDPKYGGSHKWNSRYTTFGYAGYMYMIKDRIYVFGKYFDDSVLVRINGIDVLKNIDHTAFATGKYIPEKTGWHEIEVRVADGTGEKGPKGVASSGYWSGNLGVGWRDDGITDALPESDWNKMMDPGDGSLFRNSESLEDLTLKDLFPDSYDKLTSVTLTGDVSGLRNDAFEGCFSVVNVTLEPKFGDKVFPGFYEAEFRSMSSFDDTRSIIDNSRGIVLSADMLTADTTDELTMYGYAAQMFFEGGVEYGFLAYYDDKASVKIDGKTVIAAASTECRSQTYTIKYDESGWHDIELRGWNNKGGGAAYGTCEGIMWKKGSGAWQKFADPGDGSLFRTSGSRAKILKDIFPDSYESIKNVTLTGTVTEFPMETFAGCTALEIVKLDVNSLELQINGENGWYVDEEGLLRSAKIGLNADSSMMVSVNGAGRLSYRWKASSECYLDEIYDYGYLSVDGVAKGLLVDYKLNGIAIGGHTDWQEVEFDISGSGSHSVRWVYAKDDYDDPASIGEDCVWVDDIKFRPLTTMSFVIGDATGSAPAPVVEISETKVNLPEYSGFNKAKYSLVGWSDGNTVYAPGGVFEIRATNATLSAVYEANTIAMPVIESSGVADGGVLDAAFATISMSCDEGATIYYTLDGSTPTAASAKYSGEFEAFGLGEVTIKAIALRDNYFDSPVATFTYTRKPYTLAECLNAGGWNVTSEAPAWFRVQDEAAHDGNEALRSGAVGEGGASTVKLEVHGDGQLSFWVKTSSHMNRNRKTDYLSFKIDGTEYMWLGGSNDWTNVVCDITGSGAHTLTWTFTNNIDNITYGENCAWLDEVMWMGGDKFDITYENLKGATHQNPSSYYEGMIIKFSAPSTVEGYTFSGWTPSEIIASDTGNKVVTANWEWAPQDAVVNALVTGGKPITIKADWVKTELEQKFGTGKKESFIAKFGANFASAITKKTGKKDSAGNELLVWHDYVAGTDPTDINSTFKTKIEMQDGKPIISWEPNLNSLGDERVYTVYGKERLSDIWHSPIAELDHFFKVDVAMPREGTVTFNVGGGSSVNPISVRVGLEVGELPTPTRDGYTFLGWYTAAEGGVAVTPETVVTADMTIYARWEPFGGHDKVQLWNGGPYWATTNIGAEKPEDYGYCFWWGDTIGYKRENDKWVASDGSTSNFSFERGNTPTFAKGNSQLQSEGWITSDGVLALEHDAAHVHWGNDWRMPTKQEIEDLNSKCDWTWTTMNGVNGYVVRGKGDYASNSIFLPCVGTADMTSILYLGLDGGYWSSEPNPNYLGGGYASWYIFFNSSGAEVSYRNCWNGAYVRPLQGFTK